MTATADKMAQRLEELLRQRKRLLDESMALQPEIDELRKRLREAATAASGKTTRKQILAKANARAVKLVREVFAGDSMPAVAKRHGVDTPRVRQVLGAYCRKHYELMVASFGQDIPPSYQLAELIDVLRAKGWVPTAEVDSEVE